MTASQFSESETEELLALHLTALRIRADMNDCQGLKNCSLVSKEDAAKVGPHSSYTLICLLLYKELNKTDDD